MMRWPKLPNKIKLACSPTALGRGLVVPARDGQVFWIDPLSDKSTPELLAEPFQPRLEPGAKLDWTMPTVVSDTQVIIADGKMNIYLLGVQDQPKRHLEAIKQTAMAKPITAPIGVLGQTGFVVDSAGALTILELPGLSHGKEIVLGGRCVWGPVRVGDNVLLAGDDNNLHCFDAKGGSVWRVRLEHGPLAGPPLRLGQHFLFASQNGVIWRADAATGKELAKVDTACPLGTGPVLCGQKLLVGGYDGTLYEVRQP
jgi:outer membrane protein assembly factor BamB